MTQALQQTLFTDEELARITIPFSDKVSSSDEWERRKARIGIMRADLTKWLKTDERGFPTMEPYRGVPDAPLMRFNDALSSKKYDYWVHFFVYDEFFEQIWRPEYTTRDISILSKFRGAFSPDFTQSPVLSPVQEQFNVYRSRAIGQSMQGVGINTIATVGWSVRRSFDFCFAGLSEGGTVAISTNGVLRRFIISNRLFREGVFELERQLHPENIVIFGQRIELRTEAKQLWYKNERIAYLRSKSKDGSGNSSNNPYK